MHAMHKGTRGPKRGESPHVISLSLIRGKEKIPRFLFLYQDIRNQDKQWLIPHWPFKLASSLPRFHPVRLGSPTSIISAQLSH